VIDPAGKAEVVEIIGVTARQAGDFGHGDALAGPIAKVAPDDFAGGIDREVPHAHI
jgi:hypothetical protein